MGSQTSEQRPLARPALEYLWIGWSQIVLGIGFSVFAITSTHHLAGAIVGVVFEATFYGLFMWTFSRRRLRRDLDGAQVVEHPLVRTTRDAAIRFAISTIAVAIVLVALALADDGSPIVAGIALGGGAMCLGLHRWLSDWEAEHSAVVLRTPAWRRRKDVNNYRLIRVVE